MGFVEAVTGFWDGFKSKGEDDPRSLGDKLMDGLAGAIDGLVQFLFVDTLKLFQDILNFGVRKLNSMLQPEPGSVIAGILDYFDVDKIDPIKEFTFGDDASKATTALIKGGIGSGKLDEEGNLLPTLDERVPAGTQSGAAVNIASQVQQVTENNRTSLKKDSVEKLQRQASDSGEQS